MTKGQIPSEVRDFILTKVRSVWALEVLLLLRRESSRAWTLNELTKELRSSHAAVTEAMLQFQNAGLIADQGSAGFRYHATSEKDDAIVEQLGEIYSTTPMTLIKEIVTAPRSGIERFADAFKLKKD